MKFFNTVPLLTYFNKVHTKNKNDWFFSPEGRVNLSDRQIGTDILLNQEKLFSGFEFLFGFDDGYLLLASKTGVLAVIGLGMSNNIEELINERKKSLFVEDFIFVSIVTLIFYENGILFCNDIDKIIFEKACELSSKSFS